LEEGITSIPDRLFEFFEVRGVVIPSTVGDISNQVFPIGTTVEWKGNYEFRGNTFLSYSGDFTNYTIPSIIAGRAITEIGQSAFLFNTRIRHVTIPSAVVRIGANVFVGTSSLQEVTFSPGSQLREIGNAAFMSSGLTSIEIPASVTDIGSSAFSSMSGLTSITFEDGSQLRNIGGGAFANSGIVSINIPAGVQSIAASTFMGTRNLVRVNFEYGSQLEIIGHNAFLNSAIEHLVIPGAVWSIGTSAFRQANITIELEYGRTEIQDRLFYSTGLRGSIYIPDSVLRIRIMAFARQYLTNVTIPASVTSIGYMAFERNTALEFITMKHTFPPSLNDNIFCAFAGIDRGSVTVNIPFGTTASYLSAGWHTFILAEPSVLSFERIENTLHAQVRLSAGADFDGFLTIPSSVAIDGYTLTVTAIAGNGFQGFRGYGISIPGTITGIGNLAFAGVFSLRTIAMQYTELSSIPLVSNLTFIGISRPLITLVIPYGTMQDYVDRGWTDFSIMEVEEEAVVRFTPHQWFDGTLRIPEGITKIGHGVFQGQSAIRNVHLPASLQIIYMYAFAGANNLRSVAFAERSRLEFIGFRAFWNVTSVAQIVLPNGVATMGSEAFGGWAWNQTVIMEGAGGSNWADCWRAYSSARVFSNVSIENGLFIQNGFNHRSVIGLTDWGRQQTQIVIPAGAAEILVNAFEGATSLQHITIPASVRYIRLGAFEGASNLRSVNFTWDSQLVFIGTRAFAGTTSLNRITIPGGVTTVGSEAFGGWSASQSIVITNTHIPAGWCCCWHHNSSANWLFQPY